MKFPLLITYEYPPQPARSASTRAGQHGGVAKYLEGEVKASPVPVVVIKAQDLMWRFWPRWLSLLWRARALSFTKERVGLPAEAPARPAGGSAQAGVRLWISHVLPIGYVALVWKWVFKIPYRVYLHGLDLVLPLKSPWKRFWVRKILKNADEIVVNSNATAKLLKHYGIDGSRRDAIHRVSIQYPRLENINAEQYKPIAEKLRQQHQIGDKPILLTISRLVRRKGIDLVIKSLPDVWRTIPDLVYVVVGEGEERERLSVIASEAKQSQCLSMGLLRRSSAEYGGFTPRNDNIIFTGPVSDDEKYGWLSACNCFILTPIDDPNDFEGYGIVYKEAQMFNKPVIGSRVGGVPEAIGDNGTIIASNDVGAISDAIIGIFRKFPITNFQ